jgi:hypothetical protein
MNESRRQEELWRDLLLGGSSVPVFEPPAAALHALRGRRRRRLAGQAAATLASLAFVVVAGWWSIRPRSADRPVASVPAAPSWMVRSHDRPAVAVVHTTTTPDTVSTARSHSQALVVHSRPGRFLPLSDEGLLAMFRNQSPALVGAPGERRLVFLHEDARH